MDAADPSSTTIGRWWVACYGSCVPARAGRICRRGFLPARRAFAGFSRWVKAGILRKIVASLARHLAARGQIDWDECFIDGTFSVAKKGAPRLEYLKRGKGLMRMVMAHGSGLPLGLKHTALAHP
jgi:hypothetical protein